MKRLTLFLLYSLSLWSMHQPDDEGLFTPPFALYTDEELLGKKGDQEEEQELLMLRDEVRERLCCSDPGPSFFSKAEKIIDEIPPPSPTSCPPAEYFEIDKRLAKLKNGQSKEKEKGKGAEIGRAASFDDLRRPRARRRQRSSVEFPTSYNRIEDERKRLEAVMKERRKEQSQRKLKLENEKQIQQERAILLKCVDEIKINGTQEEIDQNYKTTAKFLLRRKQQSAFLDSPVYIKNLGLTAEAETKIAHYLIKKSPIVYDICSGIRMRGYKIPGVENAKCVMFTPNGDHAVIGAGHMLIFVDVKNGKTNYNKTISLKKGGCINAFAFSEDGQKVIIGQSKEPQFSMIDLKTKGRSQISFGRNMEVKSVCFNSENSLVAISCSDGSINVVNLSNLSSVKKYRGFPEQISLAFSLYGTLLACGSSRGVIRLLDMQTGHHKKIYRGNFGGVYLIWFAAEDKELHAEFDDGTYCVWDLETNLISHMERGHKNNIQSLALSPKREMAMVTFKKSNSTLLLKFGLMRRIKTYLFKELSLEQVLFLCALNTLFGHDMRMTISQDKRRIINSFLHGIGTVINNLLRHLNRSRR